MKSRTKGRTDMKQRDGRDKEWVLCWEEGRGSRRMSLRKEMEWEKERKQTDKR